MEPLNQPVAGYRGHRRHRYMHASDFNAAARAIFEHLQRVADRGSAMGSGFLAPSMDPTAPGQVESLLVVRSDTGKLAEVLMGQSAPAAAMSTGFDWLLGHSEFSTPLVAYIGPAHVFSRPTLEPPTQSLGVC